MDFKKEIAKLLAKATGLKESQVEALIEVPPEGFGDYAFPCFCLAKSLKKNPAEIAKNFKDKLKESRYIEKMECKGPYLNFFVNKNVLTENVIKSIVKDKDKYGSGKKRKYTVMIESPGPNTNKPLHLGHVRNMVLGNSLVNLFNFMGYKTVRVDIINNRGVHICKSMLAYQNYGKNKNPDKKSDHFVGDYYVLYSQKAKEHPEFEDQIKEMLKKWEQGDKEVMALWKKMNKWALDGFKETYKRYDVKMDKAYPESEHYTKGRELVYKELEKGVFEKDENGNIVVDLEKQGLDKKVLLRADGTSVYMTQDLVLAKLRHNDYNMDKMIYVVGNEQIYHFKVLFEVFKLLKFPFAKDCYHLAYGMVYLPEGKMKSREGTVVDADDLADEICELAKKEIKKRYKKISSKELEERAENIGMGAIKFFVLKYDPMKDFTFNPEESLSFEGETGPYVQYSHARICSIMRKYGKDISKNIDYSLLTHALEIKIIKQLNQFPEIIEKSGECYKPCLLARYVFELSQSFNEYYHQCPILQAEEETKKARLLLITAIKQVLKTGLNLLGIEAPERM